MNYKKVRPVFFGCIILVSVVGLTGWFYYDFYHMPNVKQPSFVLPPAAAKQAPAISTENTVPASHPRSITIKKLDVAAPIIPLDLLKDGALDTPKTAWEVGWYNKSATPGSGGTLLLDGHVNDLVNTPGIFYKLHTLTAGDEMTIERGDRHVFNYKVTALEQLPTGSVDMKKILGVPGSSSEKIVIITCGGIYDKTKHTYTDRVIVYGERIP